MVNYSDGKIYKIDTLLGDEIYIGATAEPLLSKRFAHHTYAYKRWQNGNANKIMVFDIFDKYGAENCNIVLLENVNSLNKNDLYAKE